MANWYGAARTNYVKVAEGEAAALGEYMAKFGADVSAGYGKNEGKVCFLPFNSDDGGFSSAYDEIADEALYLEWSEVCEFLEPNQVLVVMCSGAEKLRYITGYAEAYFTSTGESCGVSINDIYAKASTLYGVQPDDITPCEY